MMCVLVKAEFAAFAACLLDLSVSRELVLVVACCCGSGLLKVLAST
jgi:hypothetical protein